MTGDPGAGGWMTPTPALRRILQELGAEQQAALLAELTEIVRQHGPASQEPTSQRPATEEDAEHIGARLFNHTHLKTRLPGGSQAIQLARQAHAALGLLRRATQGGPAAWNLAALGGEPGPEHLSRVAWELLEGDRHWNLTVRRALGPDRAGLEIIGAPQWRSDYTGRRGAEARLSAAADIGQILSSLREGLLAQGAESSATFAGRSVRQGAHLTPWASVACAALGLELGRCGAARYGAVRFHAHVPPVTVKMRHSNPLHMTPLDDPSQLLTELRTHLNTHHPAWTQVERATRVRPLLPPVRTLIRLLDHRVPGDQRPITIGGQQLSPTELGLIAAARHYHDVNP